MTKVPVLTDLTGQQILKSLNDSNTLLGDVLQELKELKEGTVTELKGLNHGIEHPVFAIPLNMTNCDKDEDGNITKIYVSVGVTGDQLVAAHTGGWDLVLWITDPSTARRYRIPFHSATYGQVNDTISMWQFRFECDNNNNPVGRPFWFGLTIMETAGVLGNPSFGHGQLTV